MIIELEWREGLEQGRKTEGADLLFVGELLSSDATGVEQMIPGST